MRFGKRRIPLSFVAVVSACLVFVGMMAVTTFVVHRGAPTEKTHAAAGWQGERQVYSTTSAYCSGSRTEFVNFYYDGLSRGDVNAESNTITLTNVRMNNRRANESYSAGYGYQTAWIKSPAGNASWNWLSGGRYTSEFTGRNLCGSSWTAETNPLGNKTVNVSGAQNTITVRVGQGNASGVYNGEWADYTISVPAATAPAIATRSVTTTSATALALSAGSITKGNYSSINTISLNYGTTTSYGSTNTLYSGTTTTPGTYTGTISGLTGNTTYYYRWNAVNSAPLTTTYTGSVVTLPPAPVLGAQTDVDTTEATYAFTASNGGGALTVSKYIRYRETGTSTWTNGAATSTATSGELTIAGLAGNTIYDLQVCSVTTAGTTCGAIEEAVLTTSDYAVTFSLSPDVISATPTAGNLASESTIIGHTALNIQTANPLGVDVTLETTGSGTALVCSTDSLRTIPSIATSGATISPVNRWGWGIADTNSASPAFSTWNPIPDVAANIHSGPIINGLKLGFGVKVGMSQQVCLSYTRDLTVTVLSILPEGINPTPVAPTITSFTMSPDLDMTYGGNTTLTITGTNLTSLDKNVYYEEGTKDIDYTETFTNVLTCSDTVCTGTVDVFSHGVTMVSSTFILRYESTDVGWLYFSLRSA